MLTVVANGDINLSKLQSFPIPGSNWKYSFHADMEFDNLQQFYRIIEKIKPFTQQVKVYGIYKKGKTIKLVKSTEPKKSFLLVGINFVFNFIY